MKTILILGGSSDLAKEFILDIDENDKQFLLQCHSNEESLRSFCKDLKATSHIFRADLASEDFTIKMLDEMSLICDAPDGIIFFQAPKYYQERFSKLMWNNFQAEIDIQLRATFLTLSKFLPAMAKKKQGKVLALLSSVTTNLPPSSLCHYVTAKYALLGLMKSLSVEFASKNIQINSLSPFMVDTKFLSNTHERIIEITAENHPLKRIASKKDILGAIRFLMSDEANYVNGINLPITGGI